MLFYFLLQVAIWIKSFVFLERYGVGQVAGRGLTTVAQHTILADILFHQGMHVLIAIAAFTFGRDLFQIDDRKLIILVIIAVFLHNVAYWLTGVFHSPVAAFFDLVQDGVTLFAFLVASKYLTNKHPFFKNLRFPIIDGVK